MHFFRDSKRKSVDTALTKKWALWVAAYTVPIFLIFAYTSDLGRAEAASICAVAISFAVKSLWDLRNRVWFRVTVAIIVLLHLPLILLIPWPQLYVPAVALLFPTFVDWFLVYGMIRLVESIIDKYGRRLQGPETHAQPEAKN